MVKQGSRRVDPNRWGVVYYQRYHCLSVCSVGMPKKEQIADITNELSREVFTKPIGAPLKKFGTAVPTILA